MKIVVLSGGSSAERSVSLESGQNVAAALSERHHEVTVIDPRDVAIDALDDNIWDIAFPMVHGTGGEDGSLQKTLMAIGLPYVGSSPKASELTFDKRATSQLLQSLGIAVPHQITVSADETIEAVQQQMQTLGAAVVTKPPQQGSSLGVSIVKGHTQLPAALNAAFQYGDVCLIEEFICGREVTVPVVNGTALPKIEVCAASGWYDYTAKYLKETTTYVVDPAGVTDDVSRIAVDACQMCGVSGIARVDFIVDAAGKPWLLEINTIPGMTSHSLVPKSAAAAGLPLSQLCEQVIQSRLQEAT